MLNHNLIEKISQKYIREQVEEEKSKLYFYLYKYPFYSSECTAITECKFIEADSERECYIKVFDAIPRLYGLFIREYSKPYEKDNILKKYVDKWEYNAFYHNHAVKVSSLYSRYNRYIEEVIEIKDSSEFFNNVKTLEYEEEDIDHINELKYEFIKNMRHVKIIMKYKKSYLCIGKDPVIMI